jgi:truncated hemoglobin YjbI
MDAAILVAMSEEETRPTPFEHFGGQATVDRLVDLFYQRMDTLPEARGIRALHPVDLGPITGLLKKYLAEWLGGPKLYSSVQGHPRLRARHLPFPIGDARGNPHRRDQACRLDAQQGRLRRRSIGCGILLFQSHEIPRAARM